jgi:UDP-N-acetylmuramate dehydrogenase
VDRTRFEEQVGTVVASHWIRRQFPLSEVTSFRVGGPADWLIDVHTADEFERVLAAAREAGVPVTLLGGGSNVLVADAGISGAVIRPRLSSVSAVDPGHVRAEAGATINGLVRWTVSRGLAGLEAWAGTPGTVGGAVYGNAHFGGRNIGDLVTSAMLVTPAGDRQVVPQAALEFAYDTSRLRRTGEILLWAEFAVTPGVPDRLRRLARESLAYRKRTQPLALPSAGCVFQNPDPLRDGLPAGMPASAGALVDRAGLKGHRIGGARISDVHANFVVNEGGASARDVRALVEAARAAVREKFGVELRDEVVYLGEF